MTPPNLSHIDPEARTKFDAYVRRRFEEVNAITPGQRAAVIDELIREAHAEGLVPLPSGDLAKLDVTDPRVQGVLDGDDVDVDGHAVSEKQTGLTAMSNPQKAAVMGGIVLLMILFILFLGAVKAGGEPEPTQTPTPTPTATPTVSVTQPPTEQPIYIFDDQVGDVSDEANAPVSLDLAGNSYVLTESDVRNREWNPESAEWLVGSEVRRVIAIPFSRELRDRVEGLQKNHEIDLRLGSGEVVTYRLLEVKRVNRNEIEIFAEKTPSLVIVLYGERTVDRLIIIAEAVQKPDVLATYVVPIPIPSVTPTLSLVGIFSETTVLTTSQVITDAVTGVRLSIDESIRVSQIGTQKPPLNKQRFMVSSVTLMATRTQVPYSGLALAITEQESIQKATDWWPEVVSVQGSLGDGMLVPGTEVHGKVAGVVNKPPSFIGAGSTPVLIWEPGGGVRYVIEINEDGGDP